MGTSKATNAHAPTAVWTNVSCDGGRIRGESSLTGPFELPTAEILAIGQHIRYEDDADWLTPDTESWISFLVPDEYGLVHRSSWGDGLGESLSDAFGEERLRTLWAESWSGWNRDRGADSRFVYPAWVYGFSVYEWPEEGRSRLRAFWGRLTGVYPYPSSSGVLGPTAWWLLEHSPAEQRRDWERWRALPHAPLALGACRSSRSWEFALKAWWAPYAITYVVAMTCAVFVNELVGSLLGWSVLAAVLALLAALWRPGLISETRLSDHGLSVRTWILRTQQCLYRDVTGVEDSATGLIVEHEGNPIPIPRSHRVDRFEIEELSARSLAIRHAEYAGLPYRLPHTRY